MDAAGAELAREPSSGLCCPRTHAVPPGPYPVNEWNPSAVCLIVAHHLLGLCCGIPAFFLLADLPEVQLITFAMLAAVLPTVPNLYLYLKFYLYLYR